MASETKTNLTRRDFLNVGALSVAGTLLDTPAMHVGKVYASEKLYKHPNIVLILTDDQHYQALGCLGHPFLHTPNLDALAEAGTLFQNSFVTSPVCWASRASLFLGQYAFAHGIHDPQIDLQTDQIQSLFPVLLRQRGYYTGHIGKFGAGFNTPDEAFDYYYGLPGDTRYIQCHNGKKQHMTRMLTDKALWFLKNCPEDKPFCLTIGMKAPHAEDYAAQPFPAETEFADWYANTSLPVNSLCDGRYFEALPEFLQRSEGRNRHQHIFSSHNRALASIRDYCRLISGIDRAVGELRAQLAIQGLADNTIIIFTSDNGYCTGQRGLEGKWLPYEDMIRVPLIIMDPRNTTSKGRVESRMVLNIDLAPTILSMAAMAIPESMQGMDLSPLIYQETSTWRQHWMFENRYNHPAIPKSTGIRTDQWKYIHWFDGTDNNQNYTSIVSAKQSEELYDLHQDALEVRNLAMLNEYEATLMHMRSLLIAAQRCGTLI